MPWDRRGGYPNPLFHTLPLPSVHTFFILTQRTPGTGMRFAAHPTNATFLGKLLEGWGRAAFMKQHMLGTGTG